MNSHTSMDVEDTDRRITNLKKINEEQTSEIVGLRRKLKAKCPPPPEPPLAFRLATVNSVFLLLENLTKERTGWWRVINRWAINAEPLRSDAAVLLTRCKKDLGKPA